MFSRDKDDYQPLLGEGETLTFRRSSSFKRRAAVLLITVVLGVCFCVTVVVSLVKTNSKNINNGPANILEEHHGTVLNGAIEQANEPTNLASLQCTSPPVSVYNITAFTGTWYEVAKVETPGLQIFQAGCHCTMLEFSSESDVIGHKVSGTVFLSCKDERVNNHRVGIQGEMEAIDIGRWMQTVFVRKTNWHLVIQKPEYAMIYECLVTNNGCLEYSIHMFSRQPDADMDTIGVFLTAADTMDLNPMDLGIQLIDQTSGICAMG